MDSGLSLREPRNDDGGESTPDHPAFRARAGERCAFFVARLGAARRDGVGVARLEPFLPFRLCFSASIRLTTLSDFSSRGAALIGLPAALRLTSAFSAVSYSSLNFEGSKCAALVSRMWAAGSTLFFLILR